MVKGRSSLGGNVCLSHTDVNKAELMSSQHAVMADVLRGHMLKGREETYISMATSKQVASGRDCNCCQKLLLSQHFM